MKASVIDLGFNSLKMVSYYVRQDNSFTAYDEHGVMAKLGEGLSQTGFLGTEPMERTIEALRMFKEVNQLQAIKHVLAVGTSPLREAGNQTQFLKSVEKETALRFRVLSGREEALLSYFGAAKATALPTVLFFDLGGGSIELTYAESYRIRKILALPLGALRLTELYASEDGKFTKKNYNRMKKRISELLPARRELGMRNDAVLVGVGGTIRAMARYDQQIKKYPFNKIHNYSMTRKSVDQMQKRLRKLSRDKIAKLKSIGSARAESIAAGSLVISTLMKVLRFDHVVVSTHGLRDGILSNFLENPLSYHRNEVDEAGIQNLLLMSHRLPANNSRNLANALFSRNFIDDREHRILTFATKRFRDDSLFSYRPETLFYFAMNEDSYLDHKDQLLLSLALVLARKRRVAEWFFQRFRGLLGSENKKSIEKLAASIELGAILELSGSGLRVQTQGDGLRLEVIGAKESFPRVLLKKAAKEFEGAFEVPLVTLMRQDTAGLKESEILGRSKSG